MATHIDQYGFLSQAPATAENLHRDNARLEKWTDMLQRWDFIQRSRKDRLKSRVRKGIPDCLRSKVWYDLSGAEEAKGTYPAGYYETLLARTGVEDVEEQIRRDLARTFPNHVLFRQPDGQDRLYRVLKAYAELDPEVGYIQGMSFITAMLLTYLSEEQAFWVLVKVIQRDGMRDFYLPGMPRAHLAFYQVGELIKMYIPDVHHHFESINMTPFLYCPAWFMTICTHQFPSESVVRIMDCYLSEGLKVIYRITLAVLRIGRKQLVNTDLTRALALLRRLPDEIATDKLIKRAFKFRLSRKTLASLEAKFRSTNSQS